MKMKRIYIEWYDCFGLDSWQKKETALLSTAELMKCNTIGFLLSKTKDIIVIAHTFNTDNQVCGVMQIPVKCIKKLEYL